MTVVILFTTYCATALYCGITVATAQCCAYYGVLCTCCGLLTYCCTILRFYHGVLRRYCAYCGFLCLVLLSFVRLFLIFLMLGVSGDRTLIRNYLMMEGISPYSTHNGIDERKIGVL